METGEAGMGVREAAQGDFPNGMFPVEDALEIILMFDCMGKISYANATARQKLEYKDNLCGRHISDVFPGTFRPAKDAAEIEDISSEDHEESCGVPEQ